MPDLSVVVVSFGGDVRRAVAAVDVAAARAGADVELVVIGHGHRPSSSAGRVVEVLPLGPGYARNRGLALASAPRVGFVDDDVEVEHSWVGAVLAGLSGPQRVDAITGPVGAGRLVTRWPAIRGRHRALLSPLWICGASNAAFAAASLADVHGFAHDFSPPRADDLARPEVFLRLVRAGRRIAWSPTLAASSSRRPRLAPRLRSRSAGRAGAGPSAAERLLPLMPPAIRDALEEPPTPFRQSHAAKTHFSYLGGHDRVLHLYANPADRLRRALREREAIRTAAGVRGIPRLLACVEAVDAIWVVEERMPGRPPDSSAPGRWFGAAADWVVAMAGPPGRPLAAVPAWNEHREAAVASAPEPLRRRIGAALAVASALPAVHMHGDLQRRNVLLDGPRVSAVDWEGAWSEGLPGLDLVFLSLFAAGAEPDASILTRLARGGDVPWGGTRGRLLRLGVGGENLPDILLSMLALWALSEDRRRERLGATPGPAVFRPLLHRFAATGTATGGVP